MASLYSLFCLVPPTPASPDDAGSDSFVFCVSYSTTMENPGPRLPVEVVERIIDAAALLPSYDTHLTPRQVHSRYKTLRSCTLLCTQLHPRSKLHLFQTIILARNGGFTRLNRLLLVLSDYPHLPALVKTVIVVDKAVRHDSQSKLTRHDATRRAIDDARGLVGTRWPGLEDLQPSREGYYAGPESTLLDAFLGQMVRFLPALRTFRTHVLPTSFDFDANPFQAIPWRRNLDSLPTHTIVVLELASVIFRSSRDFIAMLQALRLLRVVRCTQVAWSVHEWQPEWLSLPHSLALVELDFSMTDWLLDLVSFDLCATTLCSLYVRHTSQLWSVMHGQAASSLHSTHRCPRSRSSRLTKAPCSCSVVVQHKVGQIMLPCIPC